MSLRSFLFVPGDSERKLAKAETNAADALVLDLEDSVSPENIDRARGMVREYLQARRPATQMRRRQQLWVRINPIQTDKALADLAAIMPGAPDGIMLPKADSAAEAITLGHYLSALEVREGLVLESTRILPVSTETPRAMFTLGSYHGASARLYGLTWGAEDLSSAIGASTNRLLDGEYEFTYKLARSLCLLGASAAGIAAIDTLYVNFKDSEGLLADCKAARRAGFSGRIAIHPDQSAIINTAFTPDESEVAFARRVVDAFASAGGAGTLQLDGKMLDRPHLTQAQKLLELAARAVR
jgi:citrate lyase subunit beta / citryl-CoA lyase